LLKLEKARDNLIRFAGRTARGTFGPHELAFFSFGGRTFATAQSCKKEEGRNDGEQTGSDHDLIPE
jgi:hypothetical protein